MILAFAAFKWNAIDKSLKIDHCCITVFNRTVFYSDCSCIVISFFFYCFIYFFVCYCCVDLCYSNSHVFTKFYFRSYSYFCCEDERFSFFDLCYIDRWTGYNICSALIYCCTIILLDQHICCIFKEYFRSIHFLDHISWHFSFTESRKADLILLF